MGLMIGDTASITLITGLPGSGKTQRTVKFIKEAHERGELIFVCNLNGLKLPHSVCQNPRDWRSLPAGSVLVVDEAQEFFRTRRGGEAPEYITAMERIRHHGVRLVLVTQQPDYLDAHLRGLVGLHEHLVRENGAQAAKVYRHNEVMDNVRSERARSRYDSETWKYEPALFDLYTSAQVHTVKRRLSSKFKKGMVFASIAALLIGLAVYRFPALTEFGDAKAAETASASAGGDARAARPVGSAATNGEPVSVEEWAARQEPRLAAIPASAPLYDDREVTDYPRAYCMASGLDGRESCTCMTQQGSRVNMPRKDCEFIARHGNAFDPYAPIDTRAKDAEPVPLGGAGETPADTGAGRAAPAPEAARGVGSATNFQQDYGAFRG